MSFWNNPENNSLKMLMGVGGLIIVGFFAFTFMNHASLGGRGQVLNTNNVAIAPVSAGGFQFSNATNGKACTITVCSSANASQCIALSGTPAANGSCTPDANQATPAAQGLVTIINSANQ